ncbi:DUF1259 domain-containing protein [Planococcus sp. YIM B11945]|uniref:DUF1259 domain-containing protein n=1 Tax=Planococcus sp. YIM B11945 TaxID=3435410 RepID=UPI003D7DB2BB
MENLETVAEKVGMLLDSEIEVLAEKCIVKKKRAIKSSVLDLDISFERFRHTGFALNKAEIFLLPEECPVFTLALIQKDIPLPSSYKQRQVANPNIITLYLEAVEPPELFASRLAKAFRAINQLK